MTELRKRPALPARLQQMIRNVTAADGDVDYGDRLMIAAVLATGAVAIAWPQNKAAPKWILRGATFATAVWNRRSLWLDEPPAGPELHAVQ